MLPTASVSLAQSSGVRYPVLKLFKLTFAFEQRILSAICSLLISREKMAVETLDSVAAFMPMFKAKEVLPIDGLPATIIRSEF